MPTPPAGNGRLNRTSGGAATRAIHSSLERDAPFGSVTTPLYQSTTFIQSEIGVDTGFTYSRADNPTVAALERALADFEGLRHALAFSTGLSAITTLLLATLKSGDHVVCGDVVYGGTYRLLDQILSAFGVTTSFVDASDSGSIAAALLPETKLVIVETPANPTMKLCDIRALADVLIGHEALLVVDNTFLTATLQDAAGLGADVVVYSTTKYIEGHNSTVGGAILCDDDLVADRLRFIRKSLGTIQSPYNAWLTIRGLKTLPLRIAQHSTNALEVATWLEGHPRVRSVSYALLPSSPDHDLAIRQQSAGGGMLCFELIDGYDGAIEFCRRLRCCILAENLGAVETIVTHPASMTHADVSPAERDRLGITAGLVRVSVGLEDATDVIADFEQALRKNQPSIVPQHTPHSSASALHESDEVAI